MSEADRPGSQAEGQLDASLLAEIEGLQLRARLAAHGALAGMHRSLRRGASIEFSEHKLYSPGDDIRHIDWRAFAKTDRYHVKQFEDETNLSLELVLDHSGSMGFSSPGTPRKLELGRTLIAALAYLGLRQGDAVGLTTFAAGVHEALPPRATSTHLLEILHRLVRLEPTGPTRLVGTLTALAEAKRRRSLVVVVSDLFDPDPELLAAFRRLSARRHEIVVMHLLDPAELAFPYENPALFASMEDERRLFVHPRTLRNAFVTEMRKYLERTQRGLAESHVDYMRVESTTPPAQALGAMLRARAG